MRGRLVLGLICSWVLQVTTGYVWGAVRLLPTYRVFHNREIVGEVVGPSQASNLSDLGTLVAEHESATAAGSGEVRALITEQQLKLAVQSSESGPVVIGFGSAWCRKCAYLAPKYSKLAQLHPGARFFTADVASLPQDVGGVADDNSQAIAECEQCHGSGLEVCSECDGTGYIVTTAGGHEVADFCPSCSGAKKVRCSSCGGKCLMCD